MNIKLIEKPPVEFLALKFLLKKNSLQKNVISANAILKWRKNSSLKYPATEVKNLFRKSNGVHDFLCNLKLFVIEISQF